MNTILFDLDGTLLPLDMKGFIDTYFKAIGGRFQSLGVTTDELKRAINNSVETLRVNDGFLTNEELFWNTFAKEISKTGEGISREELKVYRREFDKFYKNDFFVTRLNTTPSPVAKECVFMLKNKGYRMVVATNPVFPESAMIQRIEWAGLDPQDFELITSMENSCFCKPNLNYYRKIMQTLSVTADECMMVGNDVDEDMSAIKLGIDVFLVDDCLINRNNVDTTDFKKGSWMTFREFVRELPSII